MGKKPSAKKKGKGVDLRGYATYSIASNKNNADKEAAEAAEAAEEGAPESGSQPAGDRTGPAPTDEPEREEWERLGDESAAPAGDAQKADSETVSQNKNGADVAADDEEWEKAVESRLDEELQRIEKKFIPADTIAQLERKSGFLPAGVVVLNRTADQQVVAALAPLRDEEGCMRMTFPRHWRYKGKLTYERLNNIYLGLESLNFKGEQIRWAMEKCLGFDVRAPLEMLLVNLPKEELPRQFGGESLGDDPTAAAEGSNDQPVAAAAKADVGEVAAKGAAPVQKGFEPPPRSAAEGEAPATKEAAEKPADGAKEEVAEAGKGAAEKPAEEGDEKAEEAEDEKEPTADKRKEEEQQQEERGKEEEERGAEAKAEEAREEPAKEEQPAKASPASERDFTKEWMAQYCRGGDSDSDELLDAAERLERERRQDPTARYLKVSKRFDDLVRICKQLKEKKKHGSFKQNISSDMQKQKEANAEMSKLKVEMEELERGKYGRLDRKRLDAALAARKPAAAPSGAGPSSGAAASASGAASGEAAKDTTNTKAAPTTADEPELPPLFGDGAPEAAAAATAAPAEPLPPCRAYNIASWNGRTPKQSLEDFLRKRVWGKNAPSSVASYERVPQTEPNRHRARVTVQLPRGRGSQTWDPDEACETLRDAENLAAAWALRKLSEEPDRPGLCRTLPPPFRQRWQQWEQEAAGRLREAQRELAKSRVVFLEQMLRNKPATSHSVRVAGAVNTEAASGKMWAESNEDEQFVELSADAAAKLRSEFRQRQEALESNAEFKQIQQIRAGLPVAESRDLLLRYLECHNVLIVSGATGSGKTTQVPQFVLEEALLQETNGTLPNIIVTEPRRISAVSVAKRVSQELGDPHGGPGSRGALVGYQIRLEKRTSESTRLLFCTVGVLLKQMQQGLSVLSRVTHIFIDEIHERSADCDLLLLLLRQIRSHRPDLRVVLMSATMEVDKLVRYFGSNVPVMSIPGRTFPVETFWLEDAIEMTGYRCDDNSDFLKHGWNSGWARKETFQVSGQKGRTEKLTAYLEDDDDWACDDEAECCDPTQYLEETNRTLAKLDHTRINYDLIEDTLHLIEKSEQFRAVPRDEGAILVFLPGLGEITRVHERLSRSPTFGDPSKCLVLSLHSVLSGDEHAKAFERPRRGVRKIVLSTNIAETGVTIPDVVFVVDSGKVKSQRYHEPSNTSSLKEQFISRAEVLQRRGRAGRVREGYAFHLLTRNRFDLRLQEVPTPEILRCSLMELMLSVLSSGLQPGCFSEALDPPPKVRIDQAVATLKATGAVEEGTRPANAPQWGTAEDAWYVTTPIGQCLARLPCDVRLGKMVLFAALFGGVEAVWTVAATLSHRSPLLTPFADAKKAQAKAVHLAEFLPREGPPSDHFALHAAYVRWEEARKGRGLDAFCKKHWLNNQVMQTIRDIRKDFLDSLRGDGFCEQFARAEASPQEIQSPQLAAALIFAGLYPNVARVDPPKTTEKLPLLSAGQEQLRIHPGSLCHGRVEGLHRSNHRWICYHAKQKTSQVFLRDSSFLTPHALLMFGGDTSTLNIHPVEKSISVGSGGERHWHTLHVNPRSVAMIRQLRYLFESLLRRKAMDPRRPLVEEDRAVILAYIAVINSVDLE